MPKPHRLFLTVALAAFAVLPAGGAAREPHAYWPAFPRPKRLVRVAETSGAGEAVLAQTLSGLVARKARREGSTELLWLPVGHPSYQRWYRTLVQRTGAREEPPAPVWDLVRRYHAQGLVKGYLLYRRDTAPRDLHQPGEMDLSANIATSLCGPLGGVAVSEELEARAREAGLPLLGDVRGWTEARCLEEFGSRFTRQLLAMQDPKVSNIRAEAVAADAFLASEPNALLERALARLQPDTPVLGWGVGDERKLTEPVSQWGSFQTATDWCINLPALSSLRPRSEQEWQRLRRPAAPTLWDLAWEKDVHYTAMVMSDGDNVQWLMGDFVEDRQRAYWSSPDRGKVPVGWTTCYADLAQLCPPTLEHLFSTATPKDDFLLFSGGYYYPDAFGERRPNDRVLEQHAARLGEYMRRGGLNLLVANLLQWDGEAARNAYRTYARTVPDLLGVLPVQYAPYAAGRGKTLWVPNRRGEEVPVISPRFALWAGSSYAQDGSPGKVAAMLNAMPHAGTPEREDRFSWVVVHCWSWFRQRGPGQPVEIEEIPQEEGGRPGTARGVTPIKWCVEQLQPHVRVVTPTELVLLMRLHLRPEQTLKRGLGDLEKQVRGNRAAGAAVREARRLLQSRNYQAAFERGQAAYRQNLNHPRTHSR